MQNRHHIVFVAPTAAQLADTKWDDLSIQQVDFSASSSSDDIGECERDGLDSCLVAMSTGGLLQWKVQQWSTAAANAPRHHAGDAGLSNEKLPMKQKSSSLKRPTDVMAEDACSSSAFSSAAATKDHAGIRGQAQRLPGGNKSLDVTHKSSMRARRTHVGYDKGSKDVRAHSQMARSKNEAHFTGLEDAAYDEEGGDHETSPPPSSKMEARQEAEQTRDKVHISRESGRASPVPKNADSAQMGPARPVGISRKGAPSRPPFLKTLKKQRLARSQIQTSWLDQAQSSEASSSIKDASANASRDRSFSMLASTTVESIAPPPPHGFLLANMTSIAQVLATPRNWLSEAQGGQNGHRVLRFSVLVLVVRIGPLDKVKDWKAGGDRTLDRCEVVVKDESGCVLRVKLEGTCATDWAGHKPCEESHSKSAMYEWQQHQSGRQSIGRREHSLLDRTNSESMLTGADIGGFNARETSETESMMCDTTALFQRRANAMLPLKAGDVVALQSLRLVRSRPRRAVSGWDAAGRRRASLNPLSLRAQETNGGDVYAIASPSENSALELCWRNQISDVCDADRNFDPDLVAFNARCRAIYRLAAQWHCA